MTKLTQDEIKHIVEQDLPAYKVYEGASGVEGGDLVNDFANFKSDDLAEASTPDIDTLREKYLGGKHLETDSSSSPNDLNAIPDESVADDAAGEGDPAEDEIIAVQPKVSGHPLDRGARPKAVVISGEEKKVVGEQG